MSIADELEKLDQLRLKGTISQGEFDQSKASLLAGPMPSAGLRPTELSVGARQDTRAYEKFWVQALIALFIAPVGLFLLLCVPAYRVRNSQLKRVGRAEKGLAIGVTLIAWLLAIMLF